MFVSDKSNSESDQRANKVKHPHIKLDQYFTSKKLGSFVENGKTFFRLFAHNAKEVILVVFQKPEDTEGTEYQMNCDTDGIWERILEGEQYGLLYGFKVNNSKSSYSKNIISLDPYAKAVASLNTYFTPRKAVVVKEGDYNWEGDEWIRRDWRDLIIYEMHIKDITAHHSSGCRQPGTYKGLVEKGNTGGLDYIKKLGVNTVEILPSQEFASMEAPYKDNHNGRFNTWNPYERNYWGYMTAAYFAPDEYYSYPDTKPNTWAGSDAKQVNDFKDMIKAFHKEGIAVVMDVVYNHLSEYELGNLKEIDKNYYFRFDDEENFKNESGCGNDLKTERPMLRRLIIDSILYWMKEYHVDGFRFDLGKLIDWETVEDITREAKKINPDVILVCEPWGGGYDPTGFSLRGWASWNDQFRNGIKGENPLYGPGWIFGHWYGHNNPSRIQNYVQGTVIKDSLGLFQKKEHSVNYLASHDGYTLGDFIRLAAHSAEPDTIIKDVDGFVKLTPKQLKLNKLAALFLFTSQGIVMFQEGAEFARTKVIPLDTDVHDEHKGKIDHNSYNKDNSTNYINYNHALTNNELVDYYRGLIELRNTYSSFRKARQEEITFFETGDNQFALSYGIKHHDQNIIVLFNADLNKSGIFYLPEGVWEVLADKDKAGSQPLYVVSTKVELQPSTGMVLKKSLQR